MIKIILTAIATAAFSTFLTAAEIPLSNEQIDRIFLSFIKEKEKKKEEKEKKKEESEKILTYKKDIPTNPASVVEGIDLNNPHVYGDTMPQEDLEADMNTIERPLEISGIYCEKGKCACFIGEEHYYRGDFLPSGEKILKITPNYVNTNTRKIKF